MLEVARVGSDDVVYDLGCGDGRIVVTAAKQFGARGVGVDIDPMRIADSKRNVEEAGVGDRVRIVEGDLFTMDLSPATVVTLYLLPSLNVKLRPQLFEQLRPGTRIVSHDFDMGDWEPDRVITVEGSHGTHMVYYWVMPADMAGRWRIEGGSGGELELEQRYQSASGSLLLDGYMTRVTEARVRGDTVTMTVEGSGRRTYVGKIDGDVMRLEERGTGRTIMARRVADGAAVEHTAD